VRHHTSVENIDGRPQKKYKESDTTLVVDITKLGIRVEQYPAALRAYRKWDASAEKSWTELKEIHSKTVAIANSNSRSADKLRQAKPLLERATEISEAMAISTLHDRLLEITPVRILRHTTSKTVCSIQGLT
jgi:hypothetical protein